MISNVTKYSGSYAKICAMKSKLLKESNYKRLAELCCVRDIALYLKENVRYKALFENVDINNIDRLSFEEIICHSGDSDLISLRRFMSADGKELLTLFVMEKEVAFLKQILRSIESESKYHPGFDDGGILRKYFSFDVNHIADSENLMDLADKLQGSKYYNQLILFTQNTDFYSLFNMEMALDTYYYKYAWDTAKKNLKGAEKRSFLQSYGSKIDMLNIMWILRAKKYFDVDAKTLKSLTLPIYYGLRKESIEEMINAHNEDELYRIILNTKYGDIFRDREKSFEQVWANVTMEREAKSAKVNPFSVFTIIEYLNVRETEIKNLIKIAEATEYNLDKSEILQYITMKGGR